MRMPIFRLWSVVVYETKMIMRSAAFIVFMLCIVLVLAFQLLATYYMGRIDSTLPSAVPLRVFARLSLFFAAGTAILASGRQASDRRVHTARMLRTRPAGDAGFLFGKLLGLFLTIMGTASAVSAVVLVFAAVFLKETPVVPMMHLLLPLLMTAPQTIFILGLAALLDAALRSRGPVLAGLFLYIGLAAFSLDSAAHHLFDFRGVRIPLVPSAFSGFGNPGEILGQRGMYLLLGLGLAGLALAAMDRPPQPRRRRPASLGAAVLFLIGALALGNARLEGIAREQTFRTGISALDDSLAADPGVAVTDCRIDLDHRGGEIEATAVLRFTNPNGASLDRYVFRLNPGLKVVEVYGATGPIAFDRRRHILTATPGVSLAPGASDSLTVRYRGRIDERACYPDIPEPDRNRDNRARSCTIARRYAFLTPRYVLLTREAGWYPATGRNGGDDGFIRFGLTVRTAPGLTVISQGVAERTGDGAYRFAPETPLPKISLVIGPYEQKQTVVDSTEYSVFIKRGHDTFSRHFRELGPVHRAGVIRSARRYLEGSIGLDYPFRRFAVVEVPSQFLAHVRVGALAPETIQPEQALLPERGAFLQSHPVREISKIEWQLRHSPGQPRVLTPEEIRGEALLNFFVSTFINVNEWERNSIRMGKQHAGPNGQGLFGESLFEYDYNLFPQFFSFRNGISAGGNSLLGMAFGYTLKSRLPRISGGGGHIQTLDGEVKHYRSAPVDELVTRALSGRSLAEVLADPGESLIAREVLEKKSEALVSLLTAQSGTPQDFDAFLRELLERNRFRTLPAEDLAAALRERFGIDVFAVLDRWENERVLPRFTVIGARSMEIPGPDGPVYHARFTIRNTEAIPGVVRTSFLWGSSEESGDRAERFIYLEGGQAREVGLVSRTKSLQITVDGILSRHIPRVFHVYTGEPERFTRETAFAGDRIVEPPRTDSDSLIVIVDNLDPGFSILTSPKRKPADRFRAALFRNNGETDTVFDDWFVPKSWKIGVDNLFYGPSERSAYYIGAGTGEQRVRWEADLPEPGEYDLYYYCHYFFKEYNFPNHEGDQRVKDFHFTIGHDGEEDEVELAYQFVYPWSHLGTFRVEGGTAWVELSDKTKGRLVYADAVKWVKRSSEKE